jgi:cell division protein FtsW
MNALLNRLPGDRVIWMTTFFLGLTGLLAVYSSIGALAVKHHGGDTFHFLLKQAFLLASGGAIMFYTARIQAKAYAKLSKLAMPVTAGLLLLTLILGSTKNNAARWLIVPIINQSFQTSDLAKVVLVIYMARVVAKHHGQPWTFHDVLMKLALPIGVICGLILPADLSTSALLFAVCLTVLFVGEVPMKWIASIIGLAVGSFMALIALNETLGAIDDQLAFLPRVETWANRFAAHGDASSEANYQVEHAKIAIATGGILPDKIGRGDARNWLPQSYNDMIYAFIVQEYGSLLGGIGLIMLYLWLLRRAVRIAHRAAKPFIGLAAIGIGVLLATQAMVNMAVAVGLVPVTGQPLPLVSMGGTATWFTCVAIGILLGLSREIETPPSPDARTTG